MCGIAGIFMRQGILQADRLKTLARALAHRGPDGEGYFFTSALGLVHTRLAIMDPEHGNQPFVSAAGNVVVANGEIYNDPELRATFDASAFKTGSDCEPLLALYERWGEGYCEVLRGMYAVALFDVAANRLVLSRDPFGIKPLYYVETAAFFAFASEPKALVDAGLAGMAIDEKRRAELLQLQFTTGEGTMFSAVKRVLPGETLVVVDGVIKKRLSQKKFEAGNARAAMTAPMLQLDAEINDSVTAHMRSDVPYGLFLSGGIDSSVLLKAMTASSPQRVVALTAAFPELPSKNEEEKARRVAKQFNAEHHVVEVRSLDFWNHLPALAACLDDPTSDASALPMWLLARKAREIGLKVVLSGEGADEMFGGYKRYRRSRWMFGLWRERTRVKGIVHRSEMCLSSLAGWRNGIARIEQDEAGGGTSLMQRLQSIDCCAWLPNDLLLKLDRCLMAHGIEGRTPFLDRRLSSFAYNLPDSLKVRGAHGKWLLRSWLDHADAGDDPWSRKQGFVVPVAAWLAEFGGIIEPLLERHPAILDLRLADEVAAAFSNRRSGQAAWNLLFYALWYSHHVMGLDSTGAIDEVLIRALELDRAAA